MTPREEIVKRLPFIFPVGAPNRNHCISEVAAGAIYTMLRKGTVNPKDIFRMNESEPRKALLRTRPLRLALSFGLIPAGAVKILPGVHPNVHKPKYFLEKEFAELFEGYQIHSRILAWQKKHFDRATLRRIAGIQKVVRRFTPRQKKVFLVTRYENHLRKQAADKLGLPLGTVNHDIRCAMAIICKHVRNTNISKKH
jgi:hypothetical protein